MDTLHDRPRALLLTLAVLLPLVWCAVAERFGDHLTAATSALVLVLLVVAAAATGDRTAGLVAALSGAAWFDFFLTEPTHAFTIDDQNDIEVAVLLLIIGAAVTEIALWGRRQQAASSTRAGHLDGVIASSQIFAGHFPTTELVAQVADAITDLLAADACRFVDGAPPMSAGPVLESDGSVGIRGRPINVDRDGLPTMQETVLPTRHHGTDLGYFMITASTSIIRPTLEQRQVAVLLADVVGAELASRPPPDRGEERRNR